MKDNGLSELARHIGVHYKKHPYILTTIFILLCELLGVAYVHAQSGTNPVFQYFGISVNSAFVGLYTFVITSNIFWNRTSIKQALVGASLSGLLLLLLHGFIVEPQANRLVLVVEYSIQSNTDWAWTLQHFWFFVLWPALLACLCVGFVSLSELGRKNVNASEALIIGTESILLHLLPILAVFMVYDTTINPPSSQLLTKLFSFEAGAVGAISKGLVSGMVGALTFILVRSFLATVPLMFQFFAALSRLMLPLFIVLSLGVLYQKASIAGGGGGSTPVVLLQEVLCLGGLILNFLLVALPGQEPPIPVFRQIARMGLFVMFCLGLDIAATTIQLILLSSLYISPLLKSTIIVIALATSSGSILIFLNDFRKKAGPWMSAAPRLAFILFLSIGGASLLSLKSNETLQVSRLFSPNELTLSSAQGRSLPFDIEERPYAFELTTSN